MTNIERISTPYTYSTAVAAGDYVFLGLRRGFGNTFSDQLEGALEYVQETLGELGMTLKSLVKVHVWLKRIEDLPEMETRFADYFAEDQFPARMTATTAFIDDDCLLMIEGVAYRGG